jgi:predicted nucleic acid-binding protein
VDEAAVVNASPLIFLEGAGMTGLLSLAGKPVFVPKQVLDEIAKFGAGDRTFTAVMSLSWLVVVDVGVVPAQIERWDLGSGEAAVLTWAHAHPGTTAILDDLAARRCADSLGVPVRGTLGLILTAKQRQMIPLARPVLERLRGAGMYLSDAVMNRALKTVGE